ncbi:hypothetical protein GQ55_1G301500 [Panicum hallii var. hallii]|uniref:Uncharacterized protein n=1 Tax=Panicum hallii var. hallii TaxID=1504633 RepID=A0A2T7F913_9POAL|nr:hypothetical protein GQ55_1G301500 [Panicum hallii var. hallii]
MTRARGTPPTGPTPAARSATARHGRRGNACPNSAHRRGPPPSGAGAACASAPAVAQVQSARTRTLQQSGGATRRPARGGGRAGGLDGAGDDACCCGAGGLVGACSAAAGAVVHGCMPLCRPGHMLMRYCIVSVSVLLAEQQQEEALSGRRDRGLLGLNGERSNRKEFFGCIARMGCVQPDETSEHSAGSQGRGGRTCCKLQFDAALTMFRVVEARRGPLATKNKIPSTEVQARAVVLGR